MPVKNVDDFKILLNTMVTGNYQTITLHGPGAEEKGPPFPVVATSTATPTPKGQPGGDKTGVNVTQRVTTNNIVDFQKVLNLFATPTPKPTPTASPGR